MKNVASLLLVVILAGIGYYLYATFTADSAPNPVREQQDVQPMTTLYVTDEGDIIEVTGDAQTVVLLAPAINAVALTSTVSASGARYANKDESIIFWNKGDEMFVEVEGEILYRGVRFDEASVNSQSPTIVWSMTEAGETDFGAPLSEVMVEVNSELYNLGTASGSCAEGTLELLENQVSSFLCWWAGFGTEFAVFAEGNNLLIQKGIVEEGTAETEGFRGDYKTLHTLSI